jgi:hypothetical protein
MKLLVLFTVLGVAFSLCDFSQIPFANVDDNNWCNMNGNNYLGNIKDQQRTGMCWSFSTVSFIESHFNILTNNKMRLSVEQIGDNIDEYFDDINEPCFTADNLKSSLLCGAILLI